MGRTDSAPGRARFTEADAKAKSSSVFVTRADLQPLIEVVGTPFHLYNGPGLRTSARELNAAYSWVSGPNGEGFGNFVAVKAFPYKGLLEVTQSEGMGADCSSVAELIIARNAGIAPKDIIYTSNNTPPEEFGIAAKMGVTINVDDFSHLPDVLEHAGVPEVICFRYNPGPKRRGNDLIGDPGKTKFGMTEEQLFRAYDIMRDQGVERFGLHTMVVSNERRTKYHVDTAKDLFRLAGRLSAHGINLEFINLGGGIGIPYIPGEDLADLAAISQGIEEAYQKMIVKQGIGPIRIVAENGRLIGGPNGIFVTSVLHNNDKYERFIGLDASTPDLPRAAIYPDSYHHATNMDRIDEPFIGERSLTGRLCEGNDVFGTYPFPVSQRGDIVVFHDTGAHGAAMAHQYNGSLPSAGYLRREDGSFLKVHDGVTLEEYVSKRSLPSSGRGAVIIGGRN